MLNTPFSPWPSFSEEEAEAVSKVLMSNRVNYWTGEECRQFEKEFAIWAGVPRAITVANGTLALDLALHGLGIGRANGGSADDEVIVTPRSFIASVSCVVNAGAVPVFADVDAESGNLSAATIRPHLNSRTKAVILVHLAGFPCDMDPILELSAQHGIKVIEDCAQAHGARYKGKSVGSFGHVGAWSFCQDKIMTTGGEGGMVTCQDENLWSRMWSFKDHGKSYDAVYHRQHPPGFRWLHESIGTNWRMLEFQGAVGRIQLRHLDQWHQARTKNGEAILAAAEQCEALRVPRPPEYSVHAYYRAYAFVRPELLKAGWTRDRIVAEVNAKGVPIYQGSASEIYLEKAFEHSPSRPLQRLRNARTLGETSIMFLVHPTLTADEIGLTCSVLRDVLLDASR
jgi:dTDP-4-amino-4,6-dideoxygalactose transaminase